jgi:hypothetical protein
VSGVTSSPPPINVVPAAPEKIVSLPLVTPAVTPGRVPVLTARARILSMAVKFKVTTPLSLSKQFFFKKKNQKTFFTLGLRRFHQHGPD